MRNYDYICANQYLVPLSVLPVGEYEIQVQAIDMQGDWSEFSAPIIVAVQCENVIDAPTAVCVDNMVKFSQVRILKETNRYDKFVEIGVAEMTDGEYTDMSSVATKSERCMIQAVIDKVELLIVMR